MLNFIENRRVFSEMKQADGHVRFPLFVHFISYILSYVSKYYWDNKTKEDETDGPNRTYETERTKFRFRSLDGALKGRDNIKMNPQ